MYVPLKWGVRYTKRGKKDVIMEIVGGCTSNITGILHPNRVLVLMGHPIRVGINNKTLHIQVSYSIIQPPNDTIGYCIMHPFRAVLPSK